MTGTCNDLWIVIGKISKEAYYIIDETNTVTLLMQEHVYYRVGDQIPQNALTQLYNIKPYIVFKQLLKELL